MDILVVEDDQFLRKIYGVKLEKEGYKVEIATNGEAGLKKMKEETPKIILLDLILPKMNGFDVLQEMNKDPNLKKIPVIVLTNLGQESDKDKCMKLGAKDYVIKSNVSLEEVIKKVEKYI